MFQLKTAYHQILIQESENIHLVRGGQTFTFMGIQSFRF